MSKCCSESSTSNRSCLLSLLRIPLDLEKIRLNDRTGDLMSDNEQEFQRAVVSRLIIDQNFFFECVSNGALQPDLFDGALCDLVQKQLSLFETTNTWPDQKQMQAELMLNAAQGERYADVLGDVFKELVDAEQVPISLGQLTQFLTKKRIEQTVFEAAREVQGQGWDLDQVATKLMNAGQTMFVMPSSLEMTPDHIDSDENRMTRDCTTTGIDEVDQVLGGGTARQEITCLVAPTGIGKTHLGCQMAARASQQCKDKELIIYVTCEVSKWVIASRIDAVWAGISINEVPFKKEQVRQAASKIISPPLILEFASGDCTIAAVSSVVKLKQAQGYDVRMVIIDYDEEMKQEGKAEVLRHSIGKIYRNGRKMAHDLDLGCVIISQTNGLGAQAKVVREMHVAESFTKSKAVDNMITLSAEYWLYIAKNRSGGPSHIAFPCIVNTDMCQIVITGDSMSLFEALKFSSDDRDEMDRASRLQHLNGQDQD